MAFPIRSLVNANRPPSGEEHPPDRGAPATPPDPREHQLMLLSRSASSFHRTGSRRLLCDGQGQEGKPSLSQALEHPTDSYHIRPALGRCSQAWPRSDVFMTCLGRGEESRATLRGRDLPCGSWLTGLGAALGPKDEELPGHPSAGYTGTRLRPSSNARGNHVVPGVKPGSAVCKAGVHSISPPHEHLHPCPLIFQVCASHEGLKARIGSPPSALVKLG